MYQRLVKKRFEGLVLSRPNRWHYYMLTNTVDSQFFFMSQTLLRSYFGHCVQILCFSHISATDLVNVESFLVSVGRIPAADLL